MRVTPALFLLAATTAYAQVTAVGDIVIVPDPAGTITTSQFKQSSFCASAYNGMRTVYPDQFDGIFAFSASDDFMETENTWQGTPIRTAAAGIGRGNRAGDLTIDPMRPALNGQKISECVFMGTLGRTQGLMPGLPGAEPLPLDPDAITRAFGGLFPHLTGIEMLGHEYGHHWLMGVLFDKNDGLGRRDLLRGYDDSGDPNTTGSPNQHYNSRSGSGSVMYGSCMTQLDAGTYLLEGCPRKFNHLDQYLMGLRAPNEVTAVTMLDDGSGHGDPSQPLTRGATLTVSGMTPVDVNADDVIRAEGPRVPGRGTGAHDCWRVAFVVVLAPGQTAIPPAMLQKVQNYQARIGPWFNAATDGRGFMDARLTGNGCSAVVPDGGVNLDAGVDAGQPDAGVTDAGATPDASIVDAGEPDAGDADAGAPDADVADGGIVENPEPEDAGAPPTKWDTYVPFDTGKIRPGCGCDAGGGLFTAVALAVALARRRRRG